MASSLPLDIVLEIIQYSIWKSRICSRTSQIELAKDKFHKGLSRTCKVYRAQYMTEWTRLLTLRDVMDWNFVIESGYAENVRILTLKEGALPNHTLVKAHLNFSKFGLIHTLTLDCHNDVGCNKSTGAQGQWSYKRILPCFPKDLKSLVILNAHGPDLHVIQRAVEQCGNLEHLSLGRCTKFNRPDKCDFWKQFPNDHDSYFSGRGTEGYADALGNELRALPKLKSVFVNVYLTDTKYLGDEPGSTTMDNSSTLPPPNHPTTTPTSMTLETKNADVGANEEHSEAPNALEMPSISTESQDKRDTKEAEKGASAILFGCHDSLKTAGFISFWSQDHLGWSLHEREAKDYAYVSPHKAPDPGGQAQSHTGTRADNRG